MGLEAQWSLANEPVVSDACEVEALPIVTAAAILKVIETGQLGFPATL